MAKPGDSDLNKNRETGFKVKNRNYLGLERWQQLRAHILIEDLGSLPSTHMEWLTTVYSSSSMGSDTF